MNCTCMREGKVFNLRLKFHSVSSLRKEYLKNLTCHNFFCWTIQVYCIRVSFLVQDPGLQEKWRAEGLNHSDNRLFSYSKKEPGFSVVFHTFYTIEWR